MRWPCVLTLAIALSTASGQLSEQSQTWLQMEGSFVRDANAESSMLLLLSARRVMDDARKSGALPPAVSGLALETQQAFGYRKGNAAWRYVTRLLVLLGGEKLYEGTEVASSLDFMLDRRIVEPGAMLHAEVTPLFVLGRPLKGAYTIEVRLEDSDGKVIQSLKPWKVEQLEAHEFNIPTRGLAAGGYGVRFELKNEGGQSLAGVIRELSVADAVRARLSAVVPKLDSLRSSGRSGRSAAQTLALTTAEYSCSLIDRATREYPGDVYDRLHPMAAQLMSPKTRWTGSTLNFERDMSQCEKLVEGLAADANPLADAKGDIRLAFRSAAEGSLQPFRIYIPGGYDGSIKWPAVVALHGEMGDEGTYLERLLTADGMSVVRRLADERKYIVVCPSARGPFTGYTSATERDVLEVIDRVTGVFAIDPKHVFLTGFWAGGMGTLTIGLKHSQRFAALAAVASVPETLPSAKTPIEIPVLFVQGGKDTLATPSQNRPRLEALKRKMQSFESVEIPDADHASIGVNSLKPVFDFFDRWRN